MLGSAEWILLQTEPRRRRVSDGFIDADKRLCLHPHGRGRRRVGSFHRLQGIGTRAYGGAAVREFGTVLVLVDSAVDDGGKTHV